MKAAWVIPHRTKRDVVLAATLLPQEAFAWMRAAWFTVSWIEVLSAKFSGGRKDRWALQYAAETGGR